MGDTAPARNEHGRWRRGGVRGEHETEEEDDLTGGPALLAERGEKAQRGIWLGRRVACLALLAGAVGAGHGGKRKGAGPRWRAGRAGKQKERSCADRGTGPVPREEKRATGESGPKSEMMRGRERIRFPFSFKHFQIFLN